MRRINVIGTSCAGKSTFAARLAETIGLPRVELDDLNWNPGWVPTPADVFRDKVAASTAGDAWVAVGNYASVRDLLWPRVDTIIWLDYSLPTVLRHALRRTFERVVRQKVCCNGNRETLRTTFSKDSILLWVLQTHAERRREFRRLLPAEAARGVKVIVLPTPGAADRWLRKADQGVFAARGTGVPASAIR